MIRKALLLASLGIVTACGVRGNLYLPETKPEERGKKHEIMEENDAPERETNLPGHGL